jgi:hypothetical protein
MGRRLIPILRGVLFVKPSVEGVSARRSRSIQNRAHGLAFILNETVRSIDRSIRIRSLGFKEPQIISRPSDPNPTTLATPTQTVTRLLIWTVDRAIDRPSTTRLHPTITGGAAHQFGAGHRRSRGNNRLSALNLKGRGATRRWGQCEQHDGHLTFNSGAEIPCDDGVRLHGGRDTPMSNSRYYVGLLSKSPTRTTSPGVGELPRSHPEDGICNTPGVT